jgi:hypothetical protein
MGRIPLSPQPRIVKWSGMTFDTLATDTNGDLYIGGEFTHNFPEYRTQTECPKCQHCGQYGDWHKPCEYCGAPID